MSRRASGGEPRRGTELVNTDGRFQSSGVKPETGADDLLQGQGNETGAKRASSLVPELSSCAQNKGDGHFWQGFGGQRPRGG